MNEPEIITRYQSCPVPNHDWIAVRDGYDAGDPVGYGGTEQAAIADLIEKEKQ